MKAYSLLRPRCEVKKMSDYEHFLHEKFLENREERYTFGEPVISKYEYLRENEEFLKDLYWDKSWGDKVWRNNEYQ